MNSCGKIEQWMREPLDFFSRGKYWRTLKMVEKESIGALLPSFMTTFTLYFRIIARVFEGKVWDIHIMSKDQTSRPDVEIKGKQLSK